MFIMNLCKKRQPQQNIELQIDRKESIINTLRNNLLISGTSSSKISLKKKQTNSQVLLNFAQENQRRQPPKLNLRRTYEAPVNYQKQFSNRLSLQPKIQRQKSPKYVPNVHFNYLEKSNEHHKIKKSLMKEDCSSSKNSECCFSFCKASQNQMNLLCVHKDQQRANSFVMKTNTTICESQFIPQEFEEDETDLRELKALSDFKLRKVQSIKVNQQEESIIVENFDKEYFINRFSQPIIKKK